MWVFIFGTIVKRLAVFGVVSKVEKIVQLMSKLLKAFHCGLVYVRLSFFRLASVPLAWKAKSGTHSVNRHSLSFCPRACTTPNNSTRRSVPSAAKSRTRLHVVCEECGNVRAERRSQWVGAAGCQSVRVARRLPGAARGAGRPAGPAHRLLHRPVRRGGRVHQKVGDSPPSPPFDV